MSKRNIRSSYILIGLLALFFIPAPSSAQLDTSWTLKRDKKNVKVYTRSHPDFGLDEFKGESIIPFHIDKVLKVLKSPEKMPQWVPDCEYAKLEEKTVEGQLHYTVTDLPFPLSNRDAYIEMVFHITKDGYLIRVEGLPKYKPEENGLVRIPYLKGFWKLTMLEGNKTKVTYQIQADPGGAIPTWLANATAVSTPYNTILNLQEFIKSEFD
ncbi:START domain-containing protein [Luteibaculum oceani]|uniref:START domain-containing protein n=1 Tax=Luteibaculum oceani TaxID=1294296 RepID=A0A5C6VJZ1_9FLAO|nr:START domain-containing protein [Luteibaculum oceani]TXC85249.1 hypothetical protein FRX97_01095 [Luteibaculum oceani]